MIDTKLITQNLIGALAGAIIFFIFPQLFNVVITIMFIPIQYTSVIGTILRVLVGASVGAGVNALVTKFQK